MKRKLATKEINKLKEDFNYLFGFPCSAASVDNLTLESTA